MTKRMGRPKLPKGQRKQPFALRFTSEQITAFESAAKTKGLPLRVWIESTLTGAAAAAEKKGPRGQPGGQ